MKYIQWIFLGCGVKGSFSILFKKILSHVFYIFYNEHALSLLLNFIINYNYKTRLSTINIEPQGIWC